MLRHTQAFGFHAFFLISCPFSQSNLLYHDAVGACELQAPGEVKCVHPAQGECKHHHRDVGLNARQVESSCDYNQYRVDEAREDRE